LQHSFRTRVHGHAAGRPRRAPRARATAGRRALAGALEDEEEAQCSPLFLDERKEASIARRDETQAGRDDAVDVLALRPSRAAGPQRRTRGRWQEGLVVVGGRRHLRTTFSRLVWVALPFARRSRPRSPIRIDVGGQASEEDPLRSGADARRDGERAGDDMSIDLWADNAADVSVERRRRNGHGSAAGPRVCRGLVKKRCAQQRTSRRQIAGDLRSCRGRRREAGRGTIDQSGRRS